MARQQKKNEMKKVIYQAIYRLEFPLSAQFSYENAIVFTIDKLSKLENYRKFGGEEDEDEAPLGYLVVEILTEIKDFESANDAAAHARPKLLVVLSLLSLFCDWPFTPFMSFQGGARVADALSKIAEARFVIGEEQENYTDELQKVLNAMTNAEQHGKRLIYSLLDRWRKARHMQEESQDSMEYDDEVVIAYFHVMELLGTEYYNKLRTNIKTEVAAYLDKIYGGMLLFEGEYLKTTIFSKTGLTEQIILDGLPVAGKVLFALNELGITGVRLKHLLNNLIKDRNSVAHGRTVYQDKIIFPVPPFFPNAKLNEYSLDTLKTLAAHAICRFAGSKLYSERWKLEDSNLIPTPDEIKAFVNNGKYKRLSNSDFVAGTVDDINPGAISWSMLDKKTTLAKGLEIFSDYLKNIAEDESEITQVVLAAALMVDVAIGDQLAQCEKVLQIAAKNQWHLFGSMRNILSFLEYNGWEPKHLEKMITEKRFR